MQLSSFHAACTCTCSCTRTLTCTLANIHIRINIHTHKPYSISRHVSATPRNQAVCTDAGRCPPCAPSLPFSLPSFGLRIPWHGRFLPKARLHAPWTIAPAPSTGKGTASPGAAACAVLAWSSPARLGLWHACGLLCLPWNVLTKLLLQLPSCLIHGGGWRRRVRRRAGGVAGGRGGRAVGSQVRRGRVARLEWLCCGRGSAAGALAARPRAAKHQGGWGCCMGPGTVGEERWRQGAAGLHVDGRCADALRREARTSAAAASPHTDASSARVFTIVETTCVFIDKCNSRLDRPDRDGVFRVFRAIARG